MTRVPVGGFPYSAQEWRWASAWFPLAGLAHRRDVRGRVVAGRAAGSVGRRDQRGLVVSILLTGAFHEDGLADTADALGGAYDRARGSSSS